ncbi:hypothetical protein DYB26_006175 [Aphanomyces astaci]|uniref:Fungal lipase-type domain-containing protein n=2 Tax=Aphanomyces astaci TaxID=112090 RepID=A0A3R6W7A7_APHAT|nr:hypothetical protein DYB26_006175 [Aphanomyces astaci]
MELWGTFRRGNKAAASDSDSYVKKFFESTPVEDAWKLDAQTEALKQFVNDSIAAGRRVALVTSGSATVPLNSDSVMDAVSFGDRGAATAEQFLRAGYAVIFLSRQGSLAPFSRHFQAYIRDNSFMSMLHVQPDKSLFVKSRDTSQRDHIASVLQAAKETRENVFHLCFSTVQQYLFYLQAATKAVDAAGTRAMIVLAASVLEYYVPSSSSSTGVPSSSTPADTAAKDKESSSSLSLNLIRVPNLIRKIRQEYAPKSFLVTLKSAANKNQIYNVAFEELEKWGVDAVLADSPALPGEMALVSESESTRVSLKADTTTHMELDTLCAASLVEMHGVFAARRTFLAQGRQLLLLTAKFSMMKANDAVNEDADGHKNVPFATGVRIRVDRGQAHNSPVYELSAVFQNQSHCARAHLWTRVVAPDAVAEDSASTLLTENQIVLAFSPAGTADTIKSMWGDFWGGFADKEFADVKEQWGHVTMGSAIYGLASGVTATLGGDFSSVHGMIKYLGSKLGAAWTDGEQTRIRQALQNMLSVNFNRGLTEMSGLHPLDAIDTKPGTNGPEQRDPTVLAQASITSSQPSSGLFAPSSDATTIDSTTVKVHKAILSYFQDMVADGLIEAVLPHIVRGSRVHVTGYSMGGMLGQLFLLQLGDALAHRYPQSQHHLRLVNGVFFGTPRVGDAGFAARLRRLYDTSQVINIMHPLDTVHAYPPTTEGYADAMLKIFLKEDGLGVGRRSAHAFSILPITRSLDRMLGQARPSCALCGRAEHCTEQHRCHVCTRRGDHVAKSCPYRSEGCLLCGASAHATGEHRCSVCAQVGHRGRDCHQQGNAGVAEMLTYFQFHDFLYYNQNLKRHVEFSTTATSS